jgi:hypothetical protein
MLLFSVKALTGIKVSKVGNSLKYEPMKSVLSVSGVTFLGDRSFGAGASSGSFRLSAFRSLSGKLWQAGKLSASYHKGYQSGGINPR